MDERAAVRRTYTVAQVQVTLAVTNAAGSNMVAHANYITVYVPLNVYRR
jgi:PKD repeat protein